MTSFPFDSELDSDAFGDDYLDAASFGTTSSGHITFDDIALDDMAFEAAAFDSREKAGECVSVAPLLTAFFDGEASERERSLARMHLARCTLCTRQWLQWTQTRALLQSTPPPRVPAGLLMRILIMCRLSMLRRATTARTDQTSEMPLVAAHVNADAMAMPSVDFIQAQSVPAHYDETPCGDAAIPAHLQQAILGRTTRAHSGATQNAGKESARSFAAPHEYSCAGEKRPAHTLKAFASHPMRLIRSAAPLAVPAMLLWIAFVEREPQTVPHTLDARTNVQSSGVHPNAKNRENTVVIAPKGSVTGAKTMAALPASSRNATVALQDKEAAVPAVAPLSAAAVAPPAAAHAPVATHDSPLVASASTPSISAIAKPFAALPASSASASPVVAPSAVSPRASVRLVSLSTALVPGASHSTAASNVASPKVRASVPANSRLRPRLAPARWEMSSRVGPALSATPLARVGKGRTAQAALMAAQHSNLLKVSNRAIRERAQAVLWRPAARLAPPVGVSGDEDETDDAAANSDGDPQALQDMMTEYSAALLDDDADDDANAS